MLPLIISHLNFGANLLLIKLSVKIQPFSRLFRLQLGLFSFDFDCFGSSIRNRLNLATWRYFIISFSIISITVEHESMIGFQVHAPIRLDSSDGKVEDCNLADPVSSLAITAKQCCHIWRFITNLATFDTTLLLGLFGYFWKFGKNWF